MSAAGNLALRSADRVLPARDVGVLLQEFAERADALEQTCWAVLAGDVAADAAAYAAQSLRSLAEEIAHDCGVGDPPRPASRSLSPGGREALANLREALRHQGDAP